MIQFFLGTNLAALTGKSQTSNDLTRSCKHTKFVLNGQWLKMTIYCVVRNKELQNTLIK